MIAYRAVFAARFRLLLQYRAAAAAGIWTQIFFGLVLIMVYEAFFLSSGRAQPIAFSQTASYVWLGQALLAMLPWNVDPEVRAMVRSGAVVYELTRPLDLYRLWFARAMAWRVAPTLLRAAPLTLFAAWVLPLVGLGEWRLEAPSPGSLPWFSAAMVCTLLLSCALTVLLGAIYVRTLHADGPAALLTTSVTLFSGMIVPLPLFPDWAQPALRALPFAGLADLPYRIYIGSLPPHRAPAVLLHQLGWTAAIVVAGRALLARGLRRLTVQGG